MSNEPVDHWSDTFAVSYTTTTSLFGAILGSFLIYIVIYNTPSSMKTYSIVIRVGAVCDLLFSICTFLATPRLFNTGTAIVWIFRGVCTFSYDITQDRLLTSKLCFPIYISQLNLFVYYQYILIYSYIHRYFIITRPFRQFNKHRVQIVCFILTVVFWIYSCRICNVNSNYQEEIDAIVQIVKPELVNSTKIYTAAILSSIPIYVSSRYLFIFTVVAVILVACFCSHKISRSLETLNTSKNAQETHKSILNVLRAQTVPPFVEILSISLYLLQSKFPVFRTPLVENFMFFPLVTTCIITPLVTLMFINPYKTAFYRLLTRQNNTSSAIVRTVMASQIQ